MNLKNTLNTIRNATPQELFQMAVYATGKTLLGLIVIVALTNESWAGSKYQAPYGNGTNRADADALAIAETDVRVDQTTLVSTNVNSTYTSNVGLTNNVDVAGDTNNSYVDVAGTTVEGDTITNTVEGATITNTVEGTTVEGTTVEGSTVTGGAQNQALDLSIEGDNYYNFQMGENQYEKLGDFQQSLPTLNVHAVGNNDDVMFGVGLSIAIGGTDSDEIRNMYRQQMKSQQDSQRIAQCADLAAKGISFESAFRAEGESGAYLANHVAWCNQFQFTKTERARRVAELHKLRAEVAHLTALKNNLDEKSHTTHLKRHGLQRQNAKDCKAKSVGKSTCHTVTAAHYGKAE